MGVDAHGAVGGEFGEDGVGGDVAGLVVDVGGEWSWCVAGVDGEEAGAGGGDGGDVQEGGDGVGVDAASSGDVDGDGLAGGELSGAGESVVDGVVSGS